MIQRIQTIFLMLAAVLALGVLFLPLGILPEDAPASAEVIRDPVLATESTLGLVAGLLMLVLPVTAIFLFAKRAIQLRLVFAGLLSAFLLAVVFLLSIRSSFKEMIWTAGSFLPLVYALLLGLAIRGIRKDESLVRSMDRFR